MEGFWSFLSWFSLPTASGSRKRSALAYTWSSFFIPSSLIPGKGTARRKLPFQPTHSCWKEALAGAELSQEQDSRRSRSWLLPWLTHFWMSFIHVPPVLCSSRSGTGSQAEPQQCSLLQVERKRERGAEGRRVSKGKRRKCWTVLSEQRPLETPPEAAAQLPVIRQLCAQEQGAVHIRLRGAAPSVTRLCQPPHFRQGGSGRRQEKSDSSPSQPHAIAPL